MLKIQKLCKVFNPNTINENRLFNDFNMDVKKGEFITIIGSNGAGKSTLLNLISGNIAIDSGEVLFDGKDVSFKKEYLRSKSYKYHSASIQHSEKDPPWTNHSQISKHLGCNQILLVKVKFSEDF